jgi:hypothetical protein
MLDTLLWSLKMRWSASRIDSGSDRPDPDIKLFALYHEESAGAVLDRSTALERGLIAVAELFAGHSSTDANQIVMAHELLHTLGATDKYDLGTNLPIYPYGYANPEAHSLYPQRSAELMAGRVPLDERTAEIPSGLTAYRRGTRNRGRDRMAHQSALIRFCSRHLYDWRRSGKRNIRWRIGSRRSIPVAAMLV